MIRRYNSLLSFTKLFHSPVRLFKTGQCSLEKELFVRDDRPNVNVATIGASQHGKTTLSSAITKVLSKTQSVQFRDISDIDSSPLEKEKGSYVDVALLVVDPNEGVVDDTRLYCHIAQHMNIPYVVPVINRPLDCDDETVELVHMELQELGLRHEPVTLNAKDPLEGRSDGNIPQLLDYLADVVSVERNKSGQFLMPLEQVGNIPSRGTFCAGRVVQGILAAGDAHIEAYYQGKTSKVHLREMEIFRKVTPTLEAGDRGGAFVKLKPEIELKRGGVLYSSKLDKEISDCWEVEISKLPGCTTEEIKGEAVLFHSTLMEGKVSIPQTEVGKNTPMKIQLRSKIIARPEDPIVLRCGKSFFVGTIKNPA